MSIDHQFSPLSAWTIAKDFYDPETQLIVRVSSRTIVSDVPGFVPNVHFSFEIGRLQENRVQRHFQAQCLVEYAKVRVVPFPHDVLQKLLSEAEEWVRGQRQEREDRVMENRIEREKRKGFDRRIRK
jgi:hypothetical protein